MSEFYKCLNLTHNVLLLLKSDKTYFVEYYTKAENDALQLLKADKTDLIYSYAKAETDQKLDLKADKAALIDSYTNSEDDALLVLKADKIDLIDSHSKSEDNSMLLLKADKTDLDNFVDLSSTQTISGQQQFDKISVQSVSKLSKNDASILFAGGGDILVSTLVTQPQLQEVRDIVQGKSKAYVFATTEEMNTWMEDQENVSKLSISDNLYILNKEVMDYWWDGTNLRVLKTELSDMSSGVTTLDAATGGSIAITDMSIDGNTLAPAKNTTFVTIANDQSSTGMKTFTSTFISNDIQQSGYDNNSVFLAERLIKSISDINSSVDLSNYYNKTQIYSQTETDYLLSNKANTGVSYIQREDEELLLAKADKTKLIDSYKNSQTDNLLNNKANQSKKYIQTETDQLITQINVGDVDLSNYYTITKTDELLVEKADSDYVTANFDSTTDLANYVILGTSQTITANKIFSNSCRFVSSIDGMSTGTESSFIKSSADNTVELLGAVGTKPISEFVSAPTDLSNYYTKTQTYAKEEVYNRNDTYSQTQTNSLINNKVSEDDDDYITHKVELNSFVSSSGTQQIIGIKSFYVNVTVIVFIKQGGTNQQVLLTNGTTKLFSEFVGTLTDLSNYYCKSETYSRAETNNKYVILEGLFQQTITKRLKYISSFVGTFDETQDSDANTYLTMSEVDTKLSSKMDSSTLDNFVNTTQDKIVNGSKTFMSNFSATGFAKTLMMEIQPITQIGSTTGIVICSIGTYSTDISPPTLPRISYPIQLATKRKTLTCVHSYRDIRITTDTTEA
ncbi:MAG: hypothetical protein EZS28_019960 [Streblomastix strix]|uniref:Uncharacterized protein n=1 Tax=Streblomastix strix TaxID=222440 RepID=A0A5J4VPV2_9EUKA|nr:MAG: hypothetical protein EZS28_019960 [Streblomastix strix]